jgi:hypothetical protein
VSHGSPGGGKHAVVRRYEFYKYTGAVVPPGGTSGGGKGGGPVLSTDDQEASLLCTRATPGDLTSECVAPGPGEVGDFIGAQMAAQNLGNRITPLLSWPAPSSIVYGTSLSDAELNATAAANGGAVAGAFTYTPPPGAVLPAGTHTLQVLFTPADPATYGTQSMTMSITVDKAPLTVVADHQTKVYGAPDPLLTVVATGFKAGDTQATALSGSAAVEIGSSVGSHAITIGTLETTGNYTLAFTGSTLDILPADLIITAGRESKVYGTTFAASAFTASGLLNADVVASVTLTSAGAAAATPAGSYDIVPSAALGTGLTNYAIRYVNGQLTVTPASLFVSADPKTKVAGAADPPLTFVANGFQAGDTASLVLTGALTRTPGEAPGSYAITQGALSANVNYTIALTGSTLVITAPPPPPPAGFSIAPIPPQTNTDGDEVELHVVLVRSSDPSARSASSGDSWKRGDDDNDDHERRGNFSISGLNGLKIDKEGEISGHIKANVTAVTVFRVMVTFAVDGATASQQIAWTVKPAPPRKGAKD